MAVDTEALIIEMHSQMGEVLAKVKDHHVTLYGNGQPGMRDKLVAIEQKQITCPARNRAKRDNRQFWVAFAAVVVAAIALALPYV